MLNTIQFLSRYLTPSTLVKISHLTNDEYVRKLVKQRIGYVPFRLKDFLLGEHYVTVSNTISIHIIDHNIHVYKGDKESIHFKIVQSIDNALYMIAYCAEFANIESFKLMMKTFKTVFEEFHLQKCEICHSEHLNIIINTSQNCTLTIPSYVDLTVFDGKSRDLDIKTNTLQV
jgi:hypothetical protein